MKRKVALILCVALLLGSSVAFAAVGFTSFTMTFTSTTSYQSIVADSTSKDMKVANNAYARLYVYSTTSSKNNVYRTYYSGSYVSSQYFKKLTTGTWMYYTSDVPKGKYVTLRGRPDSSVSSATVTGEFGAG